MSSFLLFLNFLIFKKPWKRQHRNKHPDEDDLHEYTEMNEKSIKLIEHTDEEADKKDMKPLPNMTMNYTHPNRWYYTDPNR